MTAAKVFMNGRSQAIRLPKAFRVKTSKVYLKKVPEGFIVVERDPWEVFEEGVKKISTKLLDAIENRKRLPNQERDWKGVFE